MASHVILYSVNSMVLTIIYAPTGTGIYSKWVNCCERLLLLDMCMHLY